MQGRVVGWLGRHRAAPDYSGKPLQGLKPSGLNSRDHFGYYIDPEMGAGVRLRLRVEAETIWGAVHWSGGGPERDTGSWDPLWWRT